MVQQLKFSTESVFSPLCNTANSDAKRPGYFFRPKISTQPGFYSIGDYGQSSPPKDGGHTIGSVYLVGVDGDDDHAPPLLAPPIDIAQIYNNFGHDNIGIAYPAPPDGYVSIGSIASDQYGKFPSLTDLQQYYRCLHNSVVIPGTIQGQVWSSQDDKGSFDNGNSGVTVYVLGITQVILGWPGYDFPTSVWQPKGMIDDPCQ